MKYYLFSHQPPPTAENGLLISGLYHWASAFGGHVGAPALSELHKLDIVHVNFTTSSLGLIDDIADAIKGEKTKLVINVDYSVDMWNKTFNYPTLILKILDRADLIFHVEPRGAQLLSHALGRAVPTLPHPVDTEALSSLALPAEQRSGQVHTILHSYDQAVMEGWIVAKAASERVGSLRSMGNPGYGAVFCNSNPDPDIQRQIPSMFNWMQTRQEYYKFAMNLAKASVVYDSYNFSCAGRVCAECAALAVPYVGHTNIFLSNELYPDTTFPRESVSEKIDAIVRLYNDPDFYRGVAERAWRGIQRYSYHESRRRMLGYLGLEQQEAKDGRRKSVVEV